MNEQHPQAVHTAPIPLSSSVDRLPATQEQENIAALVGLDRRIVDSNPDDALQFAKIRGQVVQHMEYTRDHAHLRRTQNYELFLKVGFSFVAIGTGVGLTLAGLPYPGLITLGAGLSWLAPRFMERVASSIVGGKQNVD